jgi:hypothetical protein
MIEISRFGLADGAAHGDATLVRAVSGASRTAARQLDRFDARPANCSDETVGPTVD